jgi:hypothetical protein
MHPIKLLFAMSALVAAFLASPARAEAGNCNHFFTCFNTTNCAQACTHPHTGAWTTCAQYWNWTCTPECVRGAPTHYVNVGYFEQENYSGGPLDCDLFLDREAHYTDSCGNSFFVCEAHFVGPTFCYPDTPDEPLCTGGL